LTVFEHIILGHLIGDYLLQNKWMAINKGASHFKCAVHCLLYTLAVCAATYSDLHSWTWAGVVFLSHYPIDRWSLAGGWLSLIGGRSLREFLSRGKEDIPKDMDADNYHALRGGFTALVYAAADNTLHLLLLVLGWMMVTGSAW